MARVSARLSENAPGDFFVDESCIDCETCRVVAPGVFARSDKLGLSIVTRQPLSGDSLLRAKMALVSCPASSIGTESKVDLADAVASLPEPIEGDVFYCGYASASSYGASSYLVRRPGGNVIVDSPRAARPLLDRIAELGGAQLLFLSHRDDVADHAKLVRRFGCRRVMHVADGDAVAPAAVEMPVDGDEPVELAADLVAIPVPGHTRGSMALLYANRFLFTGDHLWGDDEGRGLDASRSVCWFSWREQKRSMERLLAFDFEWVLPGHGPRFAAPVPKMRAALEHLVARTG